MKKVFTILLALLVLFAVTACGNTNEQRSNTSGQEVEDQTADEQSSAQDAANEETGGGVLVVYYSATGSTETVAAHIAEATDGDIFVITPTEPYTADDLNWRNEDSRVVQEHDDPSLQDIALETTTVDGWENYDTIFIGYPIWWGVAAWPTNGFVAANDFSGKTVIPFCTSTSLGLGESGKLLAELAGNGDWQEGQRFASNAAKDEVTDWINGLDILSEK